MSGQPEISLERAQPPEDFSAPLKALWWLKKGDLKTGAAWEKAHSICQSGEGQPALDLIHALAHRIEGKSWNADYWYSRVGEAKASSGIAEEWQSLVDRFGGGGS